MTESQQSSSPLPPSSPSATAVPMESSAPSVPPPPTTSPPSDPDPASTPTPQETSNSSPQQLTISECVPGTPPPPASEPPPGIIPSTVCETTSYSAPPLVSEPSSSSPPPPPVSEPSPGSPPPVAEPSPGSPPPVAEPSPGSSPPVAEPSSGSSPPRASEPPECTPQPPSSPPPPTPPPAPPIGPSAAAAAAAAAAAKKHPRNWWGQGLGQGRQGSPRGSRSQSRSRSREGSPVVDQLAKQRSPTKSIADLVISALVNAAGGKALNADRRQESPRSPPPANSTAATPLTEPEEVPNITFTFFDAKDTAKQKQPLPVAVNGDDDVVDEVTPDEEWEDDVQRDNEVFEAVVVLPQRISMAMTSDGDEDFVDARGTSSDSSSADSLSPSPQPPVATTTTVETLSTEEPEYVCVELRQRDPSPSLSPEPEGTPSATLNPIYRSSSYSNAVEEGLYSCPRPHGAPPPPPSAGTPVAPPTTAPPPVPEPDWTSTDSGSNQMTSEYATYYTFPNGEPTSLDGVGRAGQYEELEYCSVRSNKSPGLGLHDAPNGDLPVAPRPALRRVRSRIGRALKSVRSWWGEERLRLGDTLMKHVHAQAVGAFDNRPPRSPPPVSQSCDHVDDQEDDFVDDEDEGDAAGAAKQEDGREQGPFKRAISAPTIPRVLVLRRRKDSDLTSSVSTNISTWGRASISGRPGSALRRSRYMPEGQNGFEELRRYIKQGGDFCKDLTSILQERAEAEQVYAKSLAKLSSKLLKASKEAVGTVGQAWQRIGTEMECQGEIHRTFSVALNEEVVKPLKQLNDSQHRIRKSVESTVDKTAKSLSEWRQAESKSKKTSFMCSRDNEKLQDAMVEGRQSTRGSSLHLHHAVHSKMSEKDVAKLETKKRKAEDSVKKADVEYYTFCIRAERARLEWETAVIKGSYCLQAIEEERLQNLKELGSMYLRHVKEMGPKMVQSSDRLNEPVQMCDVASDIQTVVSLKGTGQPPSEQLLPDFYAEHVTLGMNRDRRKQALTKVLQLVKQDLERERRSKQGVENLARALQQTPNFGAEDSQQNVTEKLHHMRAMLTYLEAARYKVQSVLTELEGRPHQTHPLSQHIIVHRDRQGLQQSILKVPPWVRKDSLDQINGESPDWMDRGAADGNSVQPDSDFDEFSSQGSEKDFNGSLIISECASTTQASNKASVGTCRALYQYAANLYDELNLNPGDVINIHDKQDDGWWLGELNGTVGIFPATYVEEIK